MMGESGGLLWVQDISMEAKSIDDFRQAIIVNSGVKLELSGMAAGTFSATPYDTWLGVFLPDISITCYGLDLCRLDLPDFGSDIAVKLKDNDDIQPQRSLNAFILLAAQQ